MFEQDSLIVYAGSGVCRVGSVGKLARPVPGQDKERLYYTLVPVYGGGVVYVPVDTAVFMRPVMDAQQADALIDALPETPLLAPGSGDYRQQAEQYRAILRTYRAEDLAQLLKTLWQRQKEYRARGKALGKVDRQFLQMAQQFLFEELACALGIGVDAVGAYIQRRLAPVLPE